ncbi:MAG: hypothetical protein KAU50_10070 [Candidatus Marinimicrobia bacterium]|nr:hypothetical protein [Candidatus Neomarinimicrobiota bacterium]
MRLRGVAGQSFGAFLTDGVELRLHGLANDYVGKGISRGLVADHIRVDQGREVYCTYDRKAMLWKTESGGNRATAIFLLHAMPSFG